MMNRKGFTLYELIVTYSLAFVIIISIFSTTSDLSKKLTNLYTEDNITANQLLVYRNIGNDFAYNKINKIVKCEDGSGNTINNCATIVYNNGELQKNLEIGANYITYGGIKTEFTKNIINLSNTKFNIINTEYVDSNPNYFGRILKLNISISYNSKDYSIILFCTNGINIESKFPVSNLTGLYT